MRFGTFLGPILAALGALSIVSAGATGEKFAALSYRNGGAIELTSSTFGELADAPRDAGAAVLFTTMAGGAQCEACKQVQPHWNSLSKQWSKRRDASLVFGTLDFFKSREVFTRMHITHAPLLLYFPPGSGAPTKYDFATGSYDAEDIAAWLSTQRTEPVPYSKPFPWVKLFTAAVSLAVGLATVHFLRQHVALASGSKLLWALLVLGIIVTQTAGYMWNQIRGAPFAGMGQGGQVQYFAPGFQNQYSAETGIIAGLYTLLAFSVVALVKAVPNQPAKGRQRAGVYVWSAILLVGFSVLISIFRMKNGAYPFRLFL